MCENPGNANPTEFRPKDSDDLGKENTFNLRKILIERNNENMSETLFNFLGLKIRDLYN